MCHSIRWMAINCKYCDCNWTGAVIQSFNMRFIRRHILNVSVCPTTSMRKIRLCFCNVDKLFFVCSAVSHCQSRYATDRSRTFIIWNRVEWHMQAKKINKRQNIIAAIVAAIRIQYYIRLLLSILTRLCLPEFPGINRVARMFRLVQLFQLKPTFFPSPSRMVKILSALVAIWPLHFPRIRQILCTRSA